MIDKISLKGIAACMAFASILSFGTKVDVNNSKEVDVELNFAGDCTLGTDLSFTYSNQFTDVFKAENRYDYCY